MKTLLKGLTKLLGGLWLPGTDWDDRKTSFWFWTSLGPACYGAIVAFCGVAGILTGKQTALGMLLLIHSGIWIALGIAVRDMAAVRLGGKPSDRNLRKKAFIASGFFALLQYLALNS